MDVIALAGLPGTGKSTLARALAARLGAPVLDKDRIREALFGPDHVEHSRAQDDLCVALSYRTCEWLAESGRTRHVLLDGRTYSRAADVRALRELAGRAGLRLLLVECVCAPEVARERLAADRAAARHPARDRGPELFRRLAAAAEPLEAPDLVLATDRLSVEEAVARVLAALGTGYST